MATEMLYQPGDLASVQALIAAGPKSIPIRPGDRSIEMINNSPYWLQLQIGGQVIKVIPGFQERDAGIPETATGQAIVTPYTINGAIQISNGSAATTFVLGGAQTSEPSGAMVQLIQTSTTGEPETDVIIQNGTDEPVPIEATGNGVPLAEGIAPWTGASPAVTPENTAETPLYTAATGNAVPLAEGIPPWTGASPAVTPENTAEAPLYTAATGTAVPLAAGIAPWSGVSPQMKTTADPRSGTTTNYITTAGTVGLKDSGGIVGTIINAASATTGLITINDGTNVIWSGTLAAGQVLPIGMPTTTNIAITTASAGTIAISWA